MSGKVVAVRVEPDRLHAGKFKVVSVVQDDELEVDATDLKTAARAVEELKIAYDMPDVPVELGALGDADRLLFELDSEGAPFANWQRKVDEVVRLQSGVSLADLPDVPLRAWFDAGVLPHVAAGDALREAGWGEGDDDETFDERV